MSTDGAPAPQQTIAIAGATGDLGGRVAVALVAQGARVRALVRPDLSADDAARLAALGVEALAVDPTDLTAMTAACAGADCVVSALNGLREVMIERQGVLLDAAVAAGVPRFFPSDYAADFTATRPGRNRNFDLRREFRARADAAPIAVTSVLNGAFMDMLGAEMPILQPRIRRVLCWGSADQPMDFTLKDDVAAFTAASVLDPTTPRWLRIAGGTATARQLADLMTHVAGHRYRTLRVGPVATLSAMIALTTRLAPGTDQVFPAWQGMQYLRDMATGEARLTDLSNDRYPAVRLAPLTARLSVVAQASAPAAGEAEAG